MNTSHPNKQASTQFTYTRGIYGWVNFGVGYIPRWFSCPQTKAENKNKSWCTPLGHNRVTANPQSSVRHKFARKW